MKVFGVYMRGGTSKGVFFRASDLPQDAAERDRLLLRIVGSPDPYGGQIDGMGGGTSSTSKVMVIAPSTRPDCDIEYRFGAVAIGAPVIDWTGNCGNLTAAVGPFAIDEKLVPRPDDGVAVLRLWQADCRKQILAHVPVRGGRAWEEGEYRLDGTPFPGAEIRLEFIDPAGGEGADDGPLFPTGRACDRLEVPEVGSIAATLINAGNPLVVIEAAALRLRGSESPARCNQDAGLLARCEAIRAHAAVLMGLAKSPEEATTRRPHTPKLAWIAPPMAHEGPGGRMGPEGIDLVVRIVSMGRVHHAVTGTGAVGLAAAAAVADTLVGRHARPGREAGTLRIGHPSGQAAVGVEASCEGGQWRISRAVLGRTARRLMEGYLCAPDEFGAKIAAR